MVVPVPAASPEIARHNNRIRSNEVQHAGGVSNSIETKKGRTGNPDRGPSALLRTEPVVLDLNALLPPPETVETGPQLQAGRDSDRNAYEAEQGCLLELAHLLDILLLLVRRLGLGHCRLG